MRKIKFTFFSLVTMLILSLVYAATYYFVEPKTYDYMTKYFTANTFGSKDIILIVIDDKTAEKYRWPWKRELFCKIFDYLHDYANPKVVVHDAIFSTQDLDAPESDKKYFDSLKKYDNLVEGFSLNTYPWENTKFGEKYDKKFENKYSLNNIEVQTMPVNPFFQSMIPFPEDYFNIINNAGHVNTIRGFIDGNFMTDEIIRTSDYLVFYNGKIYPSLALQAFLVINNNPKIILKDNYIEFPELNYKIKQVKSKYRRFVPLKFYAESSINPMYTHTKYSAVDIMDSYDNIVQGKKPIIPPEIFKNKIIVIGANVSASEGLLDVKQSSVMNLHPGVDIQATAIDNIMHNNFLKILPIWANTLILIIGMLIIYFIIRKNELIKAISITILTIIGYFIICAVCFYNSIVINIITPIVMFAVTIIIAYIHRYAIENRNKKKVENIMGKYMSEDVMKTLIKNIDNLGLGGKKSQVTVLFSDIRGFTSLSENMSAEEVTQLLNEYFSEMEPIVRKYNGIINKFIGDAIMAIFGEPINDENHSQNAVRCGYEMLMKVDELQKKWQKEGKPVIKIGIGINTGEAFVGNIGTEKRMEYTVIGDTVNLASRLESYNKTYNTSMLISSSTYELSKEILEVNKISDVEIRGKANKMDIYEVVKIISNK